jgi:ribosomal protein S18 acetylase RimI-like enzyme
MLKPTTQESLIRIKYQSSFEKTVASKPVYLIPEKTRCQKSLVSQIYALQCEAFRKHLHGDLPTRDDVEWYMTRDGVGYFILKEGRRIIGYLTVRITNREFYQDLQEYDPQVGDYYPDDCHGIALAVDKPYQGRGYAVFLIEQAAGFLKDHGIKQMSFHIRVKRGGFDRLVQKFVKKIRCYHTVEDWENTGETFQFVILDL